MTAYTITGASATANVATDFTPNGIPVYPDTLTIGANKTLVVPAGYTFDATVTTTGSSTSARAKINNNGTCRVRANWTFSAWTEYQAGANAVLDVLVNKQILLAVIGSTNVPYKFYGTASEGNEIIFDQSDYVSGEPLPAIYPQSGSTPQAGLLDFDYVIFRNMFSFYYGGGNSAGNHFRLKHYVLDSVGFIKTAQNSNLADDWIMEFGDIRHSHPSDIASAFIMDLQAARNTAGTPTGTKRISSTTIRFPGIERSTKYIRAFSLDYFTDISYVSDSVIVQTSSANTAVGYKNIAARTTGVENSWQPVFGGASGTSTEEIIHCMDASDYVVTGSVHGNEARAVSEFDKCYYEEIFSQTGFDGTDYMAAPVSGNITYTRSILIMQNGGVFVNSWKGDVSANITIEHNTYICRKSDFGSNNPYGSLMRTESGNKFIAGNNQLNSNLCVVFDTSGSSDGKIAAVNFKDSAATLDQLDSFDDNNYWGMGTDLAAIYNGVNSSTKTLGQVGYGGGDTFLDPQLNNFPLTHKSPLRAFAESKGGSTTKDLWIMLCRLNGFNESTRRQETSNKINFSIADVMTGLRETCRPFNSALNRNGGTVGAVEFIAPPVVSGNFGRALTGSALSGRALTGVALTGT